MFPRKTVICRPPMICCGLLQEVKPVRNETPQTWEPQLRCTVSMSAIVGKAVPPLRKFMFLVFQRAALGTAH